MRGDARRTFLVLGDTVEQIAAERNWPSLVGQPLPDLESAWAEAKRRTAH